MGEAGPNPTLRAALAEAVEATRAASSAWRPAVAEYLYGHGLAPLYDRLAATGPAPVALVADVWRLMLDTVATRRFGVSSDVWRTGDYPDRFFPTVWLDVLPAALPVVEPARRLELVVTLFNLGENLPRSAANRLAAALLPAVDDLARAPVATVHGLVVHLGLLPGSGVPPSQWTGLVAGPEFDCQSIDPAFLPGAVAADPGRRFVVTDAVRPVALHLQAGPDGLVCRARGAAPDIEPARVVRFGDVDVRLEQRAIGWSSAGVARPLARIEAIAPAALAANADGDVVLLDAASTRVRWWRATDGRA